MNSTLAAEQMDVDGWMGSAGRAAAERRRSAVEVVSTARAQSQSIEHGRLVSVWVWPAWPVVRFASHVSFGYSVNFGSFYH